MIDLEDDFYYVCKAGNYKVVNALLKRKKHLDLNVGLYAACEGGHIDLVHLLIKKGADDWNFALQGACMSGHKYLAKMMIKRGANHLNYGLRSACYGGHKDLAEMMIRKGADDWDNGLSGACESGNVDFVQWMIDKGANDWDLGLIFACHGGHKHVVQMMIAKGEEEWRLRGLEKNKFPLKPDNFRFNSIVETWNEGLDSALSRNHTDLALMMIGKGATHVEHIMGWRRDTENYKKFILKVLFRLKGKRLTDLKKRIVNSEFGNYFVNRHGLRCDKKKSTSIFNIGQQFACKDVATFMVRFEGV